MFIFQEFTQSWKHHPIHTACHKSPLQRFTAGALLLQNSQLEAFDFFEAVDNSYGIDSDGPIPSEEGGVEIPQSSLHFSDSDLASVRQTIDPEGPSDNYGMDIYEQTLEFIHN